MQCPTCRAEVPDGTESAPFCNERCRLVDLGNWLDGRYRIAGEKNVDEVGRHDGPSDPRDHDS